MTSSTFLLCRGYHPKFSGRRRIQQAYVGETSGFEHGFDGSANADRTRQLLEPEGGNVNDESRQQRRSIVAVGVFALADEDAFIISAVKERFSPQNIPN